MNERTEALAKQAAEYAIEFAVKDQELYIPKLMEKFAELIINRIIDNVECHGDLYDSPDIKFICENIVNSVKFDFGVEE